MPEIELTTYLQSGHFISATFENFESEFLIGSAESKSLDEPEEVDRGTIQRCTAYGNRK